MVLTSEEGTKAELTWPPGATSNQGKVPAEPRELLAFSLLEVMGKSFLDPSSTVLAL